MQVTAQCRKHSHEKKKKRLKRESTNASHKPCTPENAGFAVGRNVDLHCTVDVLLPQEIHDPSLVGNAQVAQAGVVGCLTGHPMQAAWELPAVVVVGGIRGLDSSSRAS